MQGNQRIKKGKQAKRGAKSHRKKKSGWVLCVVHLSKFNEMLLIAWFKLEEFQVRQAGIGAC